MKKQAIFSSNKIILPLILPFLLAASLWACLIAPLPAQAEGGEEELWRTLETPFEYVGQVLEDKEGNIWVLFNGINYALFYESKTNETIEYSVEFSNQKILAKFENAHWITYTPESTNGHLPNDNIHAALFDQAGHLWLANSDVGVVRFDGDNWQTFTVSNTNGGLADNSVRDIFEDEAGNLWFATSSGLSRYDGKDWEVVADKETLGSGTFQLFQDSQNRLWVSLVEPQIVRLKKLMYTIIIDTDETNQKKDEPLIGVGHGVARSAPMTAAGAVTGWQTFTEADGLADDYVLSIAEDDEGNIWFGTNNGVSRFDGENWETFKSDNSDLPDNVVYQVMPGYEGEIWATTGEGVAKYVSGEWQKFADNQSTLSIFKDSERLVWFSNGDNGLDYYTGYNRQIFSKASGDLGSNHINNLFEASDGAIWVGMRDGGVSQYQERKWQTFTSDNSDLSSNEVRDLFEASDGAIWARTWRDGVSRYQEGKWQTFTSDNSDLARNGIRHLFEASDGAIWAWIWGDGVNRYQEGKWQSLTSDNSDLARNEIWNLFDARDGAIWAPTWRDGVSRYQEGKWQPFTLESGDLASNEVRDLFEASDGTIWVGTDDGGVSRYQDEKWQSFTVESGDLVSHEVWDFFESSNGAIWVRTSGGVSQYQEGKWQIFTSDNSDFASHEVWDLFEASDGVIWARTLDGGGRRYQNGKWQIFTQNEYNSLNISSIYANTTSPFQLTDRNGLTWRATNNGLVRSLPNHRRPWIEIVRVNTNPITTTALTLAYDDRKRVSIDLAGNDLVTRPENLQYLYKLENSVVDADWQQASYNMPIFFDELTAGEHTLLVKAIDEGELESEPAVLNITVEEARLTPLEWFVRGLAVLTLGGLVVFGGYWWWRQWRLVRKSID